MRDEMISALLDDMYLLQVEVSKKFYEGQCENFYLRQENGESQACDIIDRKEELEKTIYQCRLRKEFDFSKKYDLVDNHGRATPVLHRFVVKSQTFQNLFAYDGEDLGARVHSTKTSFALWAPTATSVSIELLVDGEYEVLLMKRSDKGVYRLEVERDLSQATYLYLVEVNGEVFKTLDPYALSTTKNTKRSAVIDLSVFSESLVNPMPIDPLDAVIYECSVRDFTMSKKTGTSTNGTFEAFTECGSRYQGISTGFDYLKTLGITHVQLMPVYDFATVDEGNPELSYNWGYDPLHWFGLEGSFSLNPDDPYTRIKEFKKLVEDIHQAGMYVNMDLVLNHHYDAKLSLLNRIVPYYFYRYTKENELSNGTYCGNEFESNLAMGRKYLVDQCKMWMKVYGVDGFRFDLMGILDIETMNQIASEIKDMNPSALLYGEGWNMDCGLDEGQRASVENQYKMPKIGHFNDRFRDSIKGSSLHTQLTRKGYCTGDFRFMDEAAQNLSGNVQRIVFAPRFDQPCQSINYVECHDDATLWDKMQYCCEGEDPNKLIQRQKMMMASVIFAQGIPFIHCGQEFCRTKQGYPNTYNKPDEINQIDWNRRIQYSEVVDYTKACLMIRKQFEGFRLKTTKEIQQKVQFKKVDGKVLLYDIHHEDSVLNCKGLMVLINPSDEEVFVPLDEQGIVVFGEKGFMRSNKIVKKVQVPSCTVVVLVKI